MDTTPPANPVVNEVGDSDSQITGTAESNATVYAKIGQSEIGRTTGSDTGQFVINISPQPAGTLVDVFAEDAAGNVSVATQITVVDKTAPAAPIVNKVTDQSTTVTGTSEIESEVTVKIGSNSWNGITNAEGVFSITIPKQQVGTIIEVTAKDGAGNVSAVTQVTVEDGTAPAAPVVNKVTDQSTTVTGTAEKGSEVTVKIGSESWNGTV